MVLKTAGEEGVPMKPITKNRAPPKSFDELQTAVYLCVLHLFVCHFIFICSMCVAPMRRPSSETSMFTYIYIYIYRYIHIYIHILPRDSLLAGLGGGWLRRRLAQEAPNTCKQGSILF